MKFLNSYVRTQDNGRKALTAITLLLNPAMIILGCSDRTQGVPPPVTSPANAVYYVSAANGAAGNDGSAAHPFATIGACVAILTTGQTCLVRGGIYSEMVVPPQDGVTIAGTPGESVTITAADAVINWASLGNGLYAAANVQVNTNVPMQDGHQQNFPGYQLFYNEMAVPQAQYPSPSLDPLHPNWATIASATPETNTSNNETTVIPATVTDKNAPTLLSSGAYIHIWSGSDPSLEYSGMVQSAPGGSVTYNNESVFETNYAAHGGFYYLVGAPELITGNTWAYDAQKQTLYWRPPAGVDPNHVDVRFKRRYATLDLSGRSNVTIQGINLVGAGVLMNPSSIGNVLNGITATYLSAAQVLHANGPSDHEDYYSFGIILDGERNTLENSVVAYTAVNGVTMHGTGNIVTNTLIHDVDLFGGGGAGIYVGDGAANVSGATITHNTIYNSGRAAITVSINPDVLAGSAATHVTGMEIANNNLFNTMLLTTDGGVIYGCCRDETTGSHIHDNWIHGENMQASIMPPGSSTAPHPYAGLYYDNGLGGVQASNNYVWASVPDLYLHGDLYGSQRPTSNVDFSNNSVPDATGQCSLKVSALATAANVTLVNNQVYFQPYINNQPGTMLTLQNNSPGALGVTDNFPAAALQGACSAQLLLLSRLEQTASELIQHVLNSVDSLCRGSVEERPRVSGG